MPSPRPLPSSSRSSRERRSTRDTFRQRSDNWESSGRWEQPRAQDARWRRELDADLMAMGRVWQMIRLGAVRMLGEIGRQY
jgi:hypothetical protein